MIPLFRPSVTDEEFHAVYEAMSSGWWGLGPRTEAFENEFAKYTGAAHAVAVSSGTAALELAARALGVVNTTVIVPALTFVSTAQAMVHAGNRVVFADVDERTLCLDWDDVALKLEMYPAARAVVPVWYGGTVVPPPAGIADRLTVIEDCAHAAGSALAGKVGDIACWSFQAVKNLAVGDGGMVTTGDEQVAARLRPLRWCGIDRSTWEREQGKYNWDYTIPADGEKAHMNDLAAAIGRVQLKRLPEMNARRRDIARRYNAAFAGLKWLAVPEVSDSSAMHLYVVRVSAAHRDKLVDHLLAGGVSAGVHYKPLTRYAGVFPGQHDVPATERAWQTLVTLPLFPDMTAGDTGRVIETVGSFSPPPPFIRYPAV